MPGMIDFIPNLPCIMDLDICMITGTVLMSSVVTKAVFGSIVKKSAVKGFFLFAWSCEGYMAGCSFFLLALAI